MDDSYGELFRSLEESPSYWLQVALLEFMQSLDAMSASKGVFTRKELAKRVGVSPATLSRWLNGNENITVSTMCRLATALGAAVHIHVADNTKKGRWKEEPGPVGQESTSGVTTVRGFPSNVLAYKAKLEAKPSGTAEAALEEPIHIAVGR